MSYKTYPTVFLTVSSLTVDTEEGGVEWGSETSDEVSSSRDLLAHVFLEDPVRPSPLPSVPSTPVVRP